jgi:hypothetical protein
MRVLQHSNELLPISHLPYTLPSSVSRKSFGCCSYENTGGVGVFFPFWNESYYRESREITSCSVTAYRRAAGAPMASFISLVACLQESRWPW